MDLSIIAYGVHYQPNEDLKEKLRTMLDSIVDGNSYTILDCKRMRSQNPTKPPPCKFALQSVEEKINVLRKKKDLKQISYYSGIYMRSSKSHVERAMERNFQTLLQSFPDLAQKYRLAGHTVLVKKFDYSELPSNQQQRRPDIQQYNNYTPFHTPHQQMQGTPMGRMSQSNASPPSLTPMDI